MIRKGGGVRDALERRRDKFGKIREAVNVFERPTVVGRGMKDFSYDG